DLDQCGDILNATTPDHTHDIDAGHTANQEHGEKDATKKANFPMKGVGERTDKKYTKGAHRGGTGHEQFIPTQEEGHRPAISFAKVNVRPTGPRKHGREFRKAQCAEKGEDTPGHPGCEYDSKFPRLGSN